MSNVVISLSGGADSTTLLYQLLHDESYDKIYPVFFDYQQRHRDRELDSVLKLIGDLKDTKVQALKQIDMNLRQFNNFSALTSDTQVPNQAENKQTTTVVPYRNLMLLTLSSAYAASVQANTVATAVCGEDYASYPDCRREFLNSAQETLGLCQVVPHYKLLAPYVTLSKIHIIKSGLDIGVPYENTWTCYRGDAEPCGECDSCVERTMSFYENDVKDPLYTQENWEKAVRVYRQSNLFKG